MPIHFADFLTEWYYARFTPKVELAAGSAVAAKVEIDQTTTGTTNAVHVLAAGGVGSLTETAPGTDTASSGLNGRLQRIAQRLTSLIALLPAALGAGGGLKVDGSGTSLPVSGPLTDAQLRATPVPVSGTVTASGPLTDAELRATAVPVSGPLTDTQLRAADVKISLDGEEVQGKRVASGAYASAVTVGNTATLILAANVSRIGVEVHHNGVLTARVWLGADNTLTAGASGKNIGYLDPGDAWERKDYTGAVYGRTEASTAYVSYLEV